MFGLKNKKEEFDMVGIGDLVVDSFIELVDAWIEDDNPAHSRELCMRFGDKIPYKKEVTVYGTGNSINACCAAQKMGLKTAIISNMGSDGLADECIKHLTRKGVDISNIRRHSNMETNHNFILRYKEDRTILVHHNEYNYSFPKIFPKTKWVYLSSLAHNSLKYHDEILDFLNKNKEIKLAFQPGTFQIKLGTEKLSGLIARSDLFFCNKEEAQRILKTKESDIRILLEKLQKLGPKIVVITDGPLGSYVFDGVNKYHGPMYPDIAPPVDRTGAGDAFASTFTSALILGKDIETALRLAPVNSMNVVQYVGAQAGHMRMSELEQFLKNAPENYYPIKI